MTKLEELLPDLYGKTLGTKQPFEFDGNTVFTGIVDMSASPSVLLPGGTIANIGSSTITVAASNSLHPTRADYTCTGTNDQTTINTAINALPAGGGRVLLLEGTYNISASISINSDSITLEGQGNSTILFLVAASNTDVISIGATGDNSKVKNLKIDGNMANQTTNGVGIVSNFNALAITVESCWIINTFKANIDLGGANSKIVNNYCDTTSVGSGGYNIKVAGQYSQVEQNLCNAGDGGGITITGNNILCQGNTIKNPTGKGINVSSDKNATMANYIYIANNPTGAAIYSGGLYNTIIGNGILIASGNTAVVTGISLANNYNSVTGNDIAFLTAQAHIGIADTSGYNTIMGNFLAQDNFTANAIAISLTALIENSINGNSIYGFDIGISTGASTYLDINGNTIESSTTGILITNLAKSIVSNNVIHGGASSLAIQAVNTATKYDIAINGNYCDRGISLQGVGYSNINGNNVSNATTNGILITSTGAAYSVYNTITGNVVVASTNGIKENSANDGPNIITSNISKFATNPIVTAHGSTVVANNLTI